MEDEFTPKGKFTFSVDNGASQTWYGKGDGEINYSNTMGWYLLFKDPATENNSTWYQNDICLLFWDLGYNIPLGDYISIDSVFDDNVFFAYYPNGPSPWYPAASTYEFVITITRWPGPEKTARGEVSGILEAFSGGGTVQLDGEFEFTMPGRE